MTRTKIGVNKFTNNGSFVIGIPEMTMNGIKSDLNVALGSASCRTLLASTCWA